MYDKEDTKEIQSIKEVVLEKLRKRFGYVCAVSREEREAEPAPNINSNDRARCEELAQIPAYLRISFKLSDVRVWCGQLVSDESNDRLILQALNRIASAGEAKFLEVMEIIDARYDDVRFYTESGRGWSNFAVTDCVKTATRFYQDEKLKRSERSGSIVDVVKAVKTIHERRQKALELRYGTPTDVNIERELNRDEHNARTELGLSQIKLARELEKKNAKEV